MATQEETPPQHPRLFISYREADLRFKFVDHLQDAFKRGGINMHEDQGLILDGFLDYSVKLIEDLETWKEALDFVTQRVGLVFSERSGELGIVKEIVKKVKSVLTQISLEKIEVKDGHDMMQWSKDLSSVVKNMGMCLTEYRDEHDFVVNNIDEVKRVLATIPSVRRANMFSTNISTVTSSRDSSFVTFEHLGATLFPYEQRLMQLEERLDSKVNPPKIQVFISFRGKQLRKSFVGHLVDKLRKSGINIFIDTEANIGDELNNLFKRIEESGIAVVVFSSKYTESEWCLNELVKIKERAHQGLLKVLPIFYKVTPDNVKKLKGKFGDNFRDEEHKYANDEPKIKRWKEAIVFVSHKFALTYDEKSSELEIDFIETIVKEVLKMLQAISTVET